jgi:hypothetical protein
MVLVGYFLSRCNESIPGKMPAPPKQLGVKKWKDAYQIFYQKLGDGRDIKNFRESLKNIRDSFDSHLGGERVGWRKPADINGLRNPDNLSRPEQEILDQWKNASDEDLWKAVKNFIDMSILDNSSDRSGGTRSPAESQKNIRFAFIYQEFLRIVAEEDGTEPGEEISFEKEGFLNTWEGYKKDLRDNAFSSLQTREWTEDCIGTGKILKKVIRAIEFNANGLKNNLVRWEPVHGPGSRSHKKMLSAIGDPGKTRELESWLYRLYRGPENNSAVFEGLVSCIGQRYDVLAYLFFLKDRDHFLPISPENFDFAFSLLGITLRTSGRCSWENYQKYLTEISGIRDKLEQRGLKNIHLIDAHSFCWIISQKMKNKETTFSHPPEIRPLQVDTTRPPSPPFDYTAGSGKTTEKNPDDENREKERIGKISEEIVIDAEIGRLKESGRHDLAEKVKSVSDKPSLGYDVLSYNPDNSERHIEVKTVRFSRQEISFHMSENQRQKSQSDPQYVLYFVKNPEGKSEIRCIYGKKIRSEYLTPEEYFVKIPVTEF